MNSSRRGSPLVSRKSSKSPTVSSLKDNNAWIWVVVALAFLFLLTSTCYCNGNKSDSFANTVVSGFRNTVNKITGGGNNEVRELDIIYFMSPGCPWCKKMTLVFEESGTMGDITVVDVSKPEGQKVAKEMGAASKGIPAFISKKLKTGTIGYKKTIDDLVKSLKSKENSEIKQQGPSLSPQEVMQKVQELQIVVFVSSTCGWCGKMKEELRESGVLDMVELVDVTADGGKQMALDLLGEFRGIPACYSRTTGKSFVGYKPVGEMVSALN